MTKLAIAAPLPPARGGPADYVSGLLPFLARRVEVVCLVPELDSVGADLRRTYDVRSLEQIDDPDIDLVVYHIANNFWHKDVIEAARTGPPGLAMLHDVTVHHVYEDLLRSGAARRYRALLEEAHGHRGASIADLRINNQVGEMELHLFDVLEPLVARQLGAIVHSQYTHDFVEDRVPGLPLWIIPHYAIGRPRRVARKTLGLPVDRFVVGHLGLVTRAKRPELLIEAASRLLAAGIGLHIVFAGEDLSSGSLDDAIDRSDIREHVTVTGFLSEENLDGHAFAADMIVSLRWPHIGESSGTLMRAFKAGTPVVVQKLGTWAELPPYAVVDLPDGPDEAGALADIIDVFRMDPRLRRRTGDAGRIYAASIGGADRAADLYVAAARSVLAGDGRSPLDVKGRRTAAVHAYLEGNVHPLKDVLRRLPPAHRGARLLWVGSDPGVLHSLATEWGYDIRRDEDGRRSMYPAGSFDVVTLFGTEAVIDRRVLAEINRVLRAGGLLLVAGQTVSGEDAREAGFSDAAPVPGTAVTLCELRKVTLPALEIAPIP